jgi:hypothetical protein
MDTKVIEKLAQAVHELFCEEMSARGYKYGPVMDDSKKLHSSLLPYTGLPENEKEQNRDNARDIQNKVTSAGYIIVPGNYPQKTTVFTPDEVESLAIEEHRRWMKQKITNGWRYAPETDKSNKLHKDLVPWEQLTEDDKDKDRVLVRGIPVILAKAGYTIKKPDNK